MKKISITRVLSELPDSSESVPAITGGEPVKSVSLPEYVYAKLREDVFEMRLLPGDQITETDIAAHFKVSRTPVREALQRLQGDGLVQGYVRGGWEVVPINLKRFEDLYEFRKLIEVHAVGRLCAGLAEGLADGGAVNGALIDNLKAIWCVPVSERLTDGGQVAAMDEVFHQTLVRASGNLEMASAFDRLTDRIRIVRRLDFVYGDCVQSTYDEHAAILAQISAYAGGEAIRLITEHIEGSHAEVNQITLHSLHSARAAASTERVRYAAVKVLRNA
ncbi:GntR family transcriptional regulator [Glaciimonas sp. GNP009]